MKFGIFAQFFNEVELRAQPFIVGLIIEIDDEYSVQICFYGKKGVCLKKQGKGWLPCQDTCGGVVVPKYAWELLNPISLCPYKAVLLPFFEGPIYDLDLLVRLGVSN